jgi:hypothetical protein
MRRPWIGMKDLHNFHWTKRTSSRRGHEKLGGRVFGGFSSCVIFFGKGRRRMMSLNRWWKEGEWVECLRYFERIEERKTLEILEEFHEPSQV